MIFREMLIKSAEEYSLSLTEEQIVRFSHYFEILIDWNQKINLTAITDPKEVAVKHMIDSLSCYDEAIFKNGAKIIDVGTGAGFPGLPLKIFRPDLKLTLFDSLNKRILFLKEVAEKLEIPDIEFVHSRAEEGGKNRKFREVYDIAVSRAVARLSILSELCLPFVAVGGFFIALKGSQYSQEIKESTRAIKALGGEIDKIENIKLPGLDDIRAIVYIRKIKKTLSTYPRRPGIPEKNPL
ncbi:16S rRNA (guanine(527)-N(7))-methyltransferase RsmG [Pelosinus propionicus]|uniref:Ribosomal RNA small subunit methyltransferase G n=1 Tax=Pelosinus propionicus DSM 13327 TaxID=1123291 RepID=A0A1I4KXP6_9FIRM|nr:16S rRNA (guanine(527)-N(7))-methyltransferase RsmG [Pelosinus propionicus]SFL83520.1 16S rRNA m(7)G-527 methyltransferase [Pelosinus propionicus DSM 13327]